MREREKGPDEKIRSEKMDIQRKTVKQGRIKACDLVSYRAGLKKRVRKRKTAAYVVDIIHLSDLWR